MAKQLTIYCSGCGRNHHEVGVMISLAASAFICDECVRLCVEIIEERKPAHERKQLPAPGTANFNEINANFKNSEATFRRAYEGFLESYSAMLRFVEVFMNPIRISEGEKEVSKTDG